MSGAWKGISIVVIWMAFGAVVALTAIYAKEFFPVVIGVGAIALFATLAVTHAK